MTRYGVVIAARMGSRRLPGKAMRPILRIPSVAFLIRRLRATSVGKIVLATTIAADDDVLADLGAAEGVDVCRGDIDDVVGRYVGVAEQFGFDRVVRVTGDCPFVDAETLQFCVDQYRDDEDAPIASTKTIWPIGIDYEIYDAAVMADLHRGHALRADDREHLTKFLYDRPDRFRCSRIPLMPGVMALPDGVLLTLDTPADYAFLTSVAELAGDPLAPVPALLAAAVAILSRSAAEVLEDGALRPAAAP
jgi:spore coat polysaccharide biosynthesis protein SpsF